MEALNHRFFNSHCSIDSRRHRKTSRNRMMATWARLGTSLRTIARNVSSYRSISYGGAVGVGMLGYVLASGYVRYKYQPQCKFMPHVVYAEDTKVRKTCSLTTFHPLQKHVLMLSNNVVAPIWQDICLFACWSKVWLIKYKEVVGCIKIGRH